MVATTRSLRAAWTRGGATIATAATSKSTRMPIRFITLLSLKRVRGVGAQDERRLEEPLVHEPPAAAGAVQVEEISIRTLGVLVREADPQKLGRIEAHIGF